MAVTLFRRSWTTISAITIADPAVFSSTAHNLVEDDEVLFNATTTFPTGLAADTPYYVVYEGLTADAFELSSSKGGTPLAVTVAGAGTYQFLKRNEPRLIPRAQNNK